jgi:ABC-2 type transport system permease protein
MTQQIWLIARRSIVRTFRQPGTWIPPLTFPLMLMAVNSNGLRAATHLPGFPTDSFLAFFLPFSFLQGALFASGIAGVDLARDIDTGFLNRLALTPVRGSALLIGQIGGAVGLGALQACVYLGVGLAFGVHIDTGVAGAFLILLLAVLIATGWGTLGLWLALRTGSGEGVQSQFPLLFFATFISSMNLPRNLIEVTWFRDVATINPVSYMIEGLRSLVISGWDAQALLLGFGFTLALIAVSLGLAHRQITVLFKNPSLFIPPMLFPLMNFMAFAGGLSRLRHVPGFDFHGGYTAFQFVFVLLQSAAFGGVFAGFGIARDFERGFARRLLVSAPQRSGIIAGYAIAALVRWAMIAVVLTTVGLIAGMKIGGNGVDLFGMYGLAIIFNQVGLLWACGVAMRFRSVQAGPLMQTPVFMVLFLAPVYVPLDLLSGWIHAVARLNPLTFILESGRGFIQGEPTQVALAFGLAAALFVVFAFWARTGLRAAENSG